MSYPIGLTWFLIVFSYNRAPGTWCKPFQERISSSKLEWKVAKWPSVPSSLYHSQSISMNHSQSGEPIRVFLKMPEAVALPTPKQETFDSFWIMCIYCLFASQTKVEQACRNSWVSSVERCIKSAWRLGYCLQFWKLWNCETVNKGFPLDWLSVTLMNLSFFQFLYQKSVVEFPCALWWVVWLWRQFYVKRWEDTTQAFKQWEFRQSCWMVISANVVHFSSQSSDEPRAIDVAEWFNVIGWELTCIKFQSYHHVLYETQNLLYVMYQIVQCF